MSRVVIRRGRGEKGNEAAPEEQSKDDEEADDTVGNEKLLWSMIYGEEGDAARAMRELPGGPDDKDGSDDDCSPHDGVPVLQQLE